MRDDIYFDTETIAWVLDHCETLRIGIQDGDSVYVVPVHFGYEVDDQGKFHLYFHGNGKRKRATLLRKNPHVGIELDADHKLLVADTNSGHSASFRNVMGQGIAHDLANSDEKIHGLTLLMKQYVDNIPEVFTPEMVEKVHVWRIDMENIFCKVKHPDDEWQKMLAKFGHHIETETDSNTGASKKR